MANINTQTIRVDLSTDKLLPTAFTHQNDTARTLEFSMYNKGLPYDMTGNTVKFAYKSPIVNGQYTVIAGDSMASGTVSGNKVTVALPVKYTAISGAGLLTMIITPSSGTLRPVNIKLVVQKSADGSNEIAGASDFPATLDEIAENWLDENISIQIDDTLSIRGKAADAKKTGTEIRRLNNAVDTIEDSLGLQGTHIDFGSSCPMVIEDAIDKLVNLTFSTASSYFVSNRNLMDVGSTTFTATKRVNLPFRLPAGTYTLSALVTSADTDSTTCQVVFCDGTTDVAYKQIGRDTRKSITVTASAAFDNLVLLASNSYSHSANDSATFSNVQLEIGETATSYIAHTGEVLSVSSSNELFVEYSPVCIITNDFSDITATSEDGEPDPLIPQIQASIHSIEDDLGYVGHPINYGTGFPLVVSDANGVVVDLVSNTATSCFVTNKNLSGLGTTTFTATKVNRLGATFPAGTYTFSATVTSSDTDADTCQVIFIKNGSTVWSTQIARNTRSFVTVNLTDSFDQVTLCASSVYSLSANDTATFTNVQLEAGSIPTAYVEYVGQTVALENGIGSFVVEDKPLYIYTDDFSDVNASSTYGGIEPVIPMLQQAISELRPLEGELDGKNILILGDSIIGNDRTEGVCDYLAEYSGATIYNGAIGGTRITNLRSQYEAPEYLPFDGVNIVHALMTDTWTDQDASASSVSTYVGAETLPMLKALDCSTLDFIVIAYGRNDVVSRETVANIETALDTIIDDIQSHYPAVRILVLTPVWSMFSSDTVDGDDYVNPNTNMTLRLLADTMLAKAKAKHISNHDMLENVQLSQNTMAMYMDSDHVHLNSSGNAMYAHILYGKLRSMF